MKKVSLSAALVMLILTLAWSQASQEDEYHEILTIGRGAAIGLEWEEGSNTLIARTQTSQWFYNEQLETINSTDYRWEGIESPDGTRAAFLNEDRRKLEIRGGRTGDIISELESEDGLFDFAGSAWSPDSQWLAVAKLNDNGLYEVVLFDTHSSSLRALVTS